MKAIVLVTLAIAAVAVVVVWRHRQNREVLFDGGFDVVQCETKLVESPEGTKAIILLAADLHVASAQEAMTAALAQRFLMQRMISPPTTSLLLVTIVGPCDRSAFAERWRATVAKDTALTAFMDAMEKADVGVAPSHGAISPEFESLRKK